MVAMARDDDGGGVERGEVLSKMSYCMSTGPPREVVVEQNRHRCTIHQGMVLVTIIEVVESSHVVVRRSQYCSRTSMMVGMVVRCDLGENKSNGIRAPCT